MADKPKQYSESLIQISILAGASLIFGAALQWALPVGGFVEGFFAASLLIFLCGLVLFFVWRLAGKEKVLAWMILLAFILRLALGVLFAWSLPRFGYDEEPQQAGFVFLDAYRREVSAWELAKSDEPLFAAFSNAYSADQYGGILALSAGIYRFLSPEAFRPILMTIFGAGAMALCVIFVYSTAQQWFARGTARWAGWICALLPEGILLGSSQMREPFLILFFAMLVWGVANMIKHHRLRLAISAVIISILGLFLFSFRVATPILGIISIWLWIEATARINKIWIKLLGWSVILIIGMVALFIFKDRINEIFRWDVLVTFRGSGMIQAQLERLPEILHLPFIIVYGIFQPILPAAIVDPAPWIWHGLAIFRALGWYALLPLLIYALFRGWKVKKSINQRWILFFIVAIWVWILISSVRAGGDQWDNPRYRTIFLPWMALVGGWVINVVQNTKDAWLLRILMIEGVFLLFFTTWYVDRYFFPNFRIDFALIITLILAFSGLILIWGLVADRKKKHSLTEGDEKL